MADCANGGGPVRPGIPSVSRREALRRGAVVGGALLWVTPTVRAIGLTSAGAAAASPGPASPPDAPKDTPTDPTTPTTPPGPIGQTSGPAPTTSVSANDATAAEDPSEAMGDDQGRGGGGNSTTLGAPDRPAVMGTTLEKMAATGANLDRLAVLGGASVAAGAAAVAWARRQEAAADGAAEPFSPGAAG